MRLAIWYDGWSSWGEDLLYGWPPIRYFGGVLDFVRRHGKSPPGDLNE
ncbi:hypothetical protein EMIT07CA2_30586 [Brevibacillus sp. IT-7CA2]